MIVASFRVSVVAQLMKEKKYFLFPVEKIVHFTKEMKKLWAKSHKPCRIRDIMSTRKYPDDFINKIICGDCLEVMKEMPKGDVDLVLTDPPYPDYHEELYGYQNGLLDCLGFFNCKQFIFWSAKVNFPLDYTAIHIWDKKTGCGSWYERIFERNGNKEYKVYRYYLINSTVAQNYTGDTFWGHPSQKPIKLIERLISENTKEGHTVFDPFIGSGTTAEACKLLHRNFIGIEINPDYCKIAEERLAQGVL